MDTLSQRSTIFMGDFEADEMAIYALVRNKPDVFAEGGSPDWDTALQVILDMLLEDDPDGDWTKDRIYDELGEVRQMSVPACLGDMAVRHCYAEPDGREAINTFLLLFNEDINTLEKE